MKIGNPTKDIEQSHLRDGGKYAEVYKTLDTLVNGDWLPVQFETIRQASNFQTAAVTHRTRLLEAKMRGRTIYVRNKRTKSEPRNQD